VVEDYELPPGVVFDVDSALTTLGTTEDTAYVLYHAKKDQQAVTFGGAGPVSVEDRTADDTTPAGQLTSQAAPNAVQIKRTAGADSLFAIFRPGDVVQTTAAPIQSRVVVSVDADDQITVCTPFAPPLAGATYKRLGRNVNLDIPSGNVTAGPGASDLTGAGFGSVFRPGDTVRVTIPLGGGANSVQERRVVAVVSDTVITVDSPLAPPVPTPPPPSTCLRVADEKANGLRFLSDVAPTDDTIFAGETVLNHAADLAAILCMGMTSQLLGGAEVRGAAARTNMNQSGSDLNRVYQVFRNWNLDRRRENEWRMLVGGDAVSEKRGDASALDAAMLSPLPTGPDGWTLRTPRGEAMSNQLGWLPLFRSWLDMARRPSTNTKARKPFRPDAPTNLDLSRAVAYLFDMNDPDPAP
jgi:hypothetical protein